MDQEKIALGIVAATVLILIWKFSRAPILKLLSEKLLKSGQVKLAMRIRGRSSGKSGCGGCSSGFAFLITLSALAMTVLGS